MDQNGSADGPWVTNSMWMSPRLVSPAAPAPSLSCPPPQAAAPNSVAPATPAPPHFRKSLRLSPLFVVIEPPSNPYPRLCLLGSPCPLLCPVVAERLEGESGA